MKTPWIFCLLLFVTLLSASPVAYSQDTTARDKTRDRLNALLTREGPAVKIAFQQSTKSTYVFTGMLKEGLTNCDSFEVVINVTSKETIGFRIFPHYKGGYINIDKARNTSQLLRKIAQLNDTTFLFWGADDTGDVFTGYTFTLESGFPDEAIKIVLNSIKNSDQFVGEMRPSIDGTNAP
jgi:hypothetical protein